MYLFPGEGAITPIALPNGATQVRFYSNGPATLEIIHDGADSATVALAGPAHTHMVAPGMQAIQVIRKDPGLNEVSFVVAG